MIALVDYRAGNLTSVKKTLTCLGVEVAVTEDPAVVAKAEKIILPGVGHFSATRILEQSGLRGAILRRIERGVPFLGICVGMQVLFESSAEAPGIPGLGLLAGACKPFPANVKSPHVGWNSLDCSDCSLLRGISSGSFVYFTHSYCAPVVEATVARCEYGREFSAAVEKNNVFGVQFHPEKSGSVGQALLANFCRLPC
ncbi:MAG TPA: imidazole glycerol phosphate synthase subunit HisH [Candidatus Aquilonibacter sp.]|nr:imidazole glycerol phosphate synthase subunit HisH [Candidatus Aquilonibacter sp.]